MTNLITEARELCEKATPGVWTVSGSKGQIIDSALSLNEYDMKSIVCDIWRDVEGNAAFIARSRTLIPELCDALEKHRWIPVTERLPEERQHENGEPIEFNVIISGAKVPTTLCFDGAEWRDFWKDGGYGPAYAVTHWMPLPAPPEEGAEHERD